MSAPLPVVFPKQRRSNPKNDVYHYFSTGYAKHEPQQKSRFWATSTLGQAEV